LAANRAQVEGAETDPILIFFSRTRARARVRLKKTQQQGQGFGCHLEN
jgi:hypothetical protein